jgi:hypothetical protein
MRTFAFALRYRTCKFEEITQRSVTPSLMRLGAGCCALSSPLHFPPRSVAMPRAFNAAAISGDLAPAACAPKGHQGQVLCARNQMCGAASFATRDS